MKVMAGYQLLKGATNTMDQITHGQMLTTIVEMLEEH